MYKRHPGCVLIDRPHKDTVRERVATYSQGRDFAHAGLRTSVSRTNSNQSPLHKPPAAESVGYPSILM